MQVLDFHLVTDLQILDWFIWHLRQRFTINEKSTGECEYMLSARIVRDREKGVLYMDQSAAIHDFANGVSDIDAKLIRLIGDPETRYREDPVRMLRAIRFSAKLDMTISPETEAPIAELAPLMANIPAARMFEEFLKLFISGKAEVTFEQLKKYDLFRYFFPATPFAHREK